MGKSRDVAKSRNGREEEEKRGRISEGLQGRKRMVKEA